jgi:hypothetical protein
MDGDKKLTPTVFRPTIKFEMPKPEEEDEDVAVIPKGMKFPLPKPVIEIDGDKFEVVEVRDCDDPSLINRGVFSVEEQKLYAYLPQHVTEFEVNFEKMAAHLQIGATHFPLKDIGTVTEDPTMLPTCKFLVPSKKQSSSELPSNWKFLTGFINESCTSPKLGNSLRNPGVCTPCQNGASALSACRAFEPLEDEAVLQVKTETEVHIISKHFSPVRVVTFVVDSDPKVRVHSLDEMNEHLAQTVDMDAATIEPIQKSKNSYFEKVFS